METPLYQNLQVKIEGGIANIEGEIPANVLEEYLARVVEEAGRELEIKGFRRGKAPTEIVIKEIGENALLNIAADLSLREIYPQIIRNEKLEVITPPQVQITKLARKNPLSFKAKVGIVPKFNLPDYKKIARSIFSKEEKEIFISNEEVESVINEIIKMRQEELEKAGNELQDKNVLPEITDEFVKTIGKFKNVADFKNKIKKNLKIEKELAIQRKKREDLAKKLIDETKIDIPEITLQNEMQEFSHRLFHTLQERNMTLEEYFKEIGKNEEEFMKEQRERLKDQLKMRLIIEKIAKKENIKADEKEIESQIKVFMIQYPEIDPRDIRGYLEKIMTSEKVFHFLEKIGQ